MSEHQCGCGEHSHQYNEEGSCACGAKHHSHEEGSCACPEKFWEIAEEAWKELLKEKIKAKIIAKKGEHIEKLAELIATANGEKFKHKIAAKIKCEEFKEDLKEFFLSSCEKQQ